ncbi:MAG: outer membrane protein assembly factor BamD [Alphaproteobacteria bacterium]|nr:outer membrane protein assembly factor BamD [Alphaproteobacteria bacterium]
MVPMVIAGGLLLSACASDEEVYVERPVDELYNSAMDLLLDGSFTAAAEEFDEVERQHPYSVWATKAQLMAAFSYYQTNQYDQAILSASRFIQLHPNHIDAPYAFYLVAISYYEQITDVGRDQRVTEQALAALSELSRRYPDTEYARDARLKIELARDHLAGKEMEIGRFYLAEGNFVSAINRFRIVIEEYQTTTHAPEALHRLAEAYLALGVTDEAQTAAAVLGHNYPGSDWYQDSYNLLTGRNLRPQEAEGSWITRAWRSVF